jgi:hypothetical protein
MLGDCCAFSALCFTIAILTLGLGMPTRRSSVVELCCGHCRFRMPFDWLGSLKSNEGGARGASQPEDRTTNIFAILVATSSKLGANGGVAVSD